MQVAPREKTSTQGGWASVNKFNVSSASVDGEFKIILKKSEKLIALTRCDYCRPGNIRYFR
jgi:hypothetical protein